MLQFNIFPTPSDQVEEGVSEAMLEEEPNATRHLTKCVLNAISHDLKDAFESIQMPGMSSYNVIVFFFESFGLLLLNLSQVPHGSPT